MVVALKSQSADPDTVDCTRAKCVALTFDDGPTPPFTDRLLRVLTGDDAKATFFLVGNKVAADPASARRIADAGGMEIGNHTWEHANMSTVPVADIPDQLSKGTAAIAAATGRAPVLLRTAGGLINDAVLAEAKRQGLADINWDVIPFDWINDANTGATRYMLMTQITPVGGVAARHLLEHRGPRRAVHSGAEGQRLSPGHRRPSARPPRAWEQLRQPGQRPAGQ